MVGFNRALYSSLIFLSIFTDVVFSKWMGYFGRSLLNILVPVYFFAFILLNKKIQYNSFIKKMWELAVFLLIINIISDFVYLMGGNGAVLRGENIFFKSFTQWLYWAEVVAFIAIVYNCVVELDFDSIFRPFVFTFVFLFVVLLIEWHSLPYAFTNFHYLDETFFSGGYYDRIRLTATESSLSVPLIVAYGFMSLYYFRVKENRLFFWVIVGMLATFIFTSGSKTIYFCISIAIFTYVRSIKIRNAGMIFGYVAAAVIAIAVIAYEANTFLNLMISARGTTYTIRTIPDVAAMILSIRYPFGLGGAVHYEKLVPIMNNLYEVVSNSKIGTLYSYREVLEFIQDDSKDIGIIAGWFNYLYQWGIVGGIYWIYTFAKFFKGAKEADFNGKGILLAGLNCIVFMIMFTMPFSNHYMTWAYIIIAGLIVNQALEGVQATDGLAYEL